MLDFPEPSMPSNTINFPFILFFPKLYLHPTRIINITIIKNKSNYLIKIVISF